MRRFWIAVIVVLLVGDAVAIAELWRLMGEKLPPPDKVAAREGKDAFPSSRHRALSVDRTLLKRPSP